MNERGTSIPRDGLLEKDPPRANVPRRDDRIFRGSCSGDGSLQLSNPIHHTEIKREPSGRNRKVKKRSCRNPFGFHQGEQGRSIDLVALSGSSRGAGSELLSLAGGNAGLQFLEPVQHDRHRRGSVCLGFLDHEEPQAVGRNVVGATKGIASPAKHGSSNKLSALPAL